MIEERLFALETRSRKTNIKFLWPKSRKLDKAFWPEVDYKKPVEKFCRKIRLDID